MAPDNISKLIQLKELFDRGIITKEELESEKQKLLSGKEEVLTPKDTSNNRTGRKSILVWSIGVAVFAIIAIVLLLLPKGKDNTNEKAQRLNGHAYVDLGLSVKWATSDVGAIDSQSYGHRFLWGSIEQIMVDAKEWDHDLYMGRSKEEEPEVIEIEEEMVASEIETIMATSEQAQMHYEFPKYNRTDKKMVLEFEDDPASHFWGDNWRTPTLQEFEELFNNCSISVTIVDTGVECQRQHTTFTSKLNGNSITLVGLAYMTSSLDAEFTDSFYVAVIQSDGGFYFPTVQRNNINMAAFVRPVCE